MSYVVAVVGATGAVGREMLRTLEQRAFPAKRVIALASARTAGTKLPFAGGEITVEEVYAAYRSWCEDNGHAKATKQNFGRDLRAAVPWVSVKRGREGEARFRVYSGISLMDHVCA